jgi:sugar phosphate isomerase/epimerase
MESAYFADRFVRIRPSVSCLAMYSIRRSFNQDPDETLKRVAEFGIRQVGVRGTGTEGARKLKSLLQIHGLSAPQMMLEPGLGLQEQVEAAAMLGCQFITIPASPVFFEQHSDGRFQWRKSIKSKEFAAFVSQLPALSAQAKAAGLQLLYHFHDFDFVTMDDDLSPYDWMTTRLPPDAISFHLDIAWLVQARADLCGVLQRLFGRVAVLDLKDVRPEKPAPQRGANMFPAGQGIVDFASAAALFVSAGASLLMIENEPLDDEFGGVATALDHLRSIGVVA